MFFAWDCFSFFAWGCFSIFFPRPEPTAAPVARYRHIALILAVTSTLLCGVALAAP
jgi:hypothetical protein